MNRYVLAALLALVLVVPAPAQAIGGGSVGGGSSSSSSSGGRSAGSSSSSGSGSSSSRSGSSSSSSGAPRSGISSSRYQPSGSRPSSGPAKQPTSAHLIPRSLARPSDLEPRARAAWVTRGRPSIGRDTRFLRDRRNREYLDPYSSRYYGRDTSPYSYLYIEALADTDNEDPVSPQRCRDYDRKEKYCKDFVVAEENGGDCSGGFVLFPYLLLGLVGLGARRYVR